MVIILDAGGFSDKTYQGYLERSLFGALARTRPQDIFIYTKHVDNQETVPGSKVMAPPRQSGLFVQKRNEKWVKRHHVEGWISFKKLLNVSAPLRQWLIIGSEEQLKDEKTIGKAGAIGLASTGLQLAFNEKYPQFTRKGFLIQGWLDDEWGRELATATDMKMFLTMGKEYFINADFNLSKERLTTLLKGFSVFKRMLHSGWKLVVVLRSEEGLKLAEVQALLANYKYREDIVITDDASLPEKMEAAYALISLDGSERVPLPVLEAVRVKTPVIAPATHTLKQMFAEEVIYTESLSSEAVGDTLMNIYKDETLRRKLVSKMESRSLVPGLKETAEKLSRILDQ